ncbi:nucleoside deaminase [Haliea atlantica]
MSACAGDKPLASLSGLLPDWLAALNRGRRHFDSDAAAMQLAVVAAERNIVEGGGPFGAVVLGPDGQLLAVAANRVLPARCSLWHAEMLAMALAQERIGSHDLGSVGPCSLYTTCAPCAMCFGAIPFAGLHRLVCAAATEDAEAVGFDEGAKPDNWVSALETRGIAVTLGVLAEQGRALLQSYQRAAGAIY